MGSNSLKDFLSRFRRLMGPAGRRTCVVYVPGMFGTSDPVLALWKSAGQLDAKGVQRLLYDRNDETLSRAIARQNGGKKPDNLIIVGHCRELQPGVVTPQGTTLRDTFWRLEGCVYDLVCGSCCYGALTFNKEQWSSLSNGIVTYRHKIHCHFITESSQHFWRLYVPKLCDAIGEATAAEHLEALVQKMYNDEFIRLCSMRQGEAAAILDKMYALANSKSLDSWG